MGSALLLGFEARALACSIALPGPGAVNCEAQDPSKEHTSAADVELQVEAIEVERARYPPPGHGDCGDIGRAKVQFKLAGHDSWPSDLGVLLRLSSGDFPWSEPPTSKTDAGSGWLMSAEGGKVSFVGQEDPRKALDITLTARAIDCAGSGSSLIQVHITDAGKASGCSITRRASRPSPTTVLSLLASAVILRRALRRRARTPVSE
jgi:hypothetical protein